MATRKPRRKRQTDYKPTSRERSREALTTMVAARDAFYGKAMAEGWQPLPCERRLVRECWTGVDVPGVVEARPYLLEGSQPGGWSAEAQRSPEWRAWKRARDGAINANWGLVAKIVIPRIPPRKRADEHEDEAQEDIWSEARIGLMRGIDLWSPEHLTSPATYLGRWILQGTRREIIAQQKRNERIRPLIRRSSDDEDSSARESKARAWEPSDLCQAHGEDLDPWSGEDAMIAALDIRDRMDAEGLDF